MLEGLRGYLQIASGLTEVTRQRAQAVATSLTSSGEALTTLVTHDVRGQVGGLAEELFATSKANRELLLSLVRSEVERQVGRLGLVPSADLEAATARADRLEARLRKLETQVDRQVGGDGVASTKPAGRSVPAPVPTGDTPFVATKKAAAKKAVATTSATKRKATDPKPDATAMTPAGAAVVPSLVKKSPAAKRTGVTPPAAGRTSDTSGGAPVVPPAVGPDGGVL